MATRVESLQNRLDRVRKKIKAEKEKRAKIEAQTRKYEVKEENEDD